VLKFLVGLFTGLGVATATAFAVDINGRGVLEGWIVQKDGQTICENPEAYPDFKGQGSFIICS
jgi:hypothetical protein